MYWLPAALTIRSTIHHASISKYQQPCKKVYLNAKRISFKASHSQKHGLIVKEEGFCEGSLVSLNDPQLNSFSELLKFVR